MGKCEAESVRTQSTRKVDIKYGNVPQDSEAQHENQAAENEEYQAHIQAKEKIRRASQILI
jgi:hypothetical protein